LEEEMLRFQVADARHRLDRQRLVVEEVERRVGELEMRAPFDGMVATVAVEDRDAVARNQAVMGIVDLRQLEVAVAIPEAFADDVAPGLPAVVVVDGSEHPGVLTRVAPEVQSSQVEGRVAFAGGTPPGLRQNQRVATRLVVDERRDVVKVPRGPFLEGSGGRTVWVVADDLARRRRVEVGAVSVTEVEIVSGLEAGEEIVLSDLPVAEGTETVLLRD
jgi:HlyD family secretion protein